MISNDEAVDILVVQLKAAIRRLLDTKGVRGRVLDKVNRYGEIVIGVILERATPPDAGAGGGAGTSARSASSEDVADDDGTE